MAGLDETVDVGPVGLEALRLAVRSERAADVRPLVPVQAEPAEHVVELRLAVLAEAGSVGVLDAEDELAALLAREGEVEERHVGGADVRVAGRRRRHAGAHRAGAVRGRDARRGLGADLDLARVERGGGAAYRGGRHTCSRCCRSWCGPA